MKSTHCPENSIKYGTGWRAMLGCFMYVQDRISENCWSTPDPNQTWMRFAFVRNSHAADKTSPSLTVCNVEMKRRDLRSARILSFFHWQNYGASASRNHRLYPSSQSFISERFLLHDVPAGFGFGFDFRIYRSGNLTTTMSAQYKLVNHVRIDGEIRSDALISNFVTLAIFNFSVIPLESLNI